MLRFNPNSHTQPSSSVKQSDRRKRVIHKESLGVNLMNKFSEINRQMNSGANGQSKGTHTSSSPIHNIVRTRLSHPKSPDRHSLRENHHVPHQDTRIHSTPHLEQVEDNDSSSNEEGLPEVDVEEVL